MITLSIIWFITGILVACLFYPEQTMSFPYPIYTTLCHMEEVDDTFGFVEGDYNKLLQFERNGSPIIVLREATDMYFDVQLPDGSEIQALAHHHLQCFNFLG